jgi:hypothetical protein
MTRHVWYTLTAETDENIVVNITPRRDRLANFISETKRFNGGRTRKKVKECV